MSSNWSFLRSDPNRLERNPIHEEFFSASEILTDVSALVRESIQNSLDAAKSDEVTVRFSLGKTPTKNVKTFFNGLEEHVKSALTIDHNKFNSDDCNYLVVEDFNTTGLLGKVTANGTDAKADSKNNGYWFFAKANGDSGKGNGTRGTWGIGKVVFPKMSAIKTFFAYSVRESDGILEPIVFGQSLLKFHDVSGQRFEPDGWWGHRNASNLDIPFNSEAVESFAKSWMVSRNSDQEGLSIVIPWVDPDIGIGEIASCVLRDYFVALLQGKLACEFEDENGTFLKINKETTIDQLTIKAEKDSSWATVLGLANIFNDWSNGELKEFSFDLTSNNKWQSLEIADEVVDQMIAIHDSDKPLAIRVHCKIPGTTNGKSKVEDSFVTLIARRDVKEKAIFSRSGILIPKANPNRISGSIALVVIDPTHSDHHCLSTLLSAAEGPAHENWSKDGDRFKDTYTPRNLAEDTLTMVRKAPSEIVKLVSAISDGKDTEWLADSFPMPDGARPSQVTTVSPPNDDNTNPPPVIVIPPSEPRDLRINKVQGGFSITGDHSELADKFAIINVAYEMRRGNSQKGYRTSDFNLGKMIKSSKGVTVAAKDNTLQLSDFESDFRISFDGFDPIRDLEIISRISDKSEVI